MSQEQWLQILTLTYTASSVVGCLLFTYMWRLTRRDRLDILDEIPPTDPEKENLLVVARRAEVVAGVLALAFTLYTLVSVIAVVQRFELIHLPVEPGLIPTVLLVAGNVMEMLIAVVLVRARRQINARHGS